MAVILNPRSGVSPRRQFDVRSALAARGLRAEIVELKPGDDVRRVAATLADADHTPLVAAGGDGTVSAVASVLAGGKGVLGVLPLGTLNHFARDLGIPLDLDAAVGVLTRDGGRVTPVDVGGVNGRTFINNVSLGLYPAFVRARGNVRRHGRIARWWKIAAAASHVLARMPLLLARITLDGRSFKRITPLVFISNNECVLEGPGLGARPTISGGCLSLLTTRRRGPWGLFRLALRAALGSLRGARDFDSFTASEVELQTRGWTARIAIDGEVVTMKTPLRIVSRAGALRVLVPAHAAESQSAND